MTARAEAAEHASACHRAAWDAADERCKAAESEAAALRAENAKLISEHDALHETCRDLRAEVERFTKQWDEHCASHGSESPHALQDAIYRITGGIAAHLSGQAPARSDHERAVLEAWEALGELTSYVVDGHHVVRVDDVRGVMQRAAELARREAAK